MLVIIINLLRRFVINIFAMAMVVMGGMFFQSITALRKILFWCCNHGDGSDGRTQTSLDRNLMNTLWDTRRS